MNHRYNGMYVGIVVQNNDPENRGRVKVYVPHINASVYQNWYEVKKNKKFKFPGGNINSDLTTVMSELKDILPWALQASPLVGQSASGRVNAYHNVASVSDTNSFAHFTSTSAESTDTSLNPSGIGEKPARKYEYETGRLSDAFSSDEFGDETGAKHPNKYSYHYRPTSYSNCAKGVFGIPNVGAHVFVFFLDGDPTDPIYFAASFGQDDWQSVFGHENATSPDYPGSYENTTSQDSEVSDINVETYRNKFLINQKGGTLEFVNTDNREILKMTHYSGSFKEFNNQTTVELATNNDQKLVIGDQYQTVKGYRSVYTGRDLDYIVQGDHFLRVGKQDTGLHRAWREKARELHIIKQLFETKRAAIGDLQNTILVDAMISPLQTKSGENDAACPVCVNSSKRHNKLWDLNETWSSVGIPITDSSGNDASELGAYTGAYTLKAAFAATGGGQIFGENCPSCANSAKMQGSMDGSFPEETLKTTDWIDEAKRVIADLADIEASLGMGGSEIINVAKHKTETIGMAMNDFGSIRTDLEGKFYKSHLSVLKEGVTNSRTVSPLIEYVHVDDLPGGSYTLNVCNRWNVNVGAGGVSMKSYGPVDIGGTIVNMGGTQVNIGSENEVNIDGGKRLHIVSDILTLRQRERKQVLVDSNLGVTQNVIIGGGLHVEGELSCHHISGPVEIQETELERVYAKLLEGLEFSADLSGGTHTDAADSSDNHNSWTGVTVTLTADSNDDKVLCYDHSHNFKNLAMDLYSTNEKVRTIVAKKCEEADRVPPEGRSQARASTKVDERTS